MFTKLKNIMLSTKQFAMSLDCRSVLSTYISKGKLPKEFHDFVEDTCEGAEKGLDIGMFRSLNEWAEWLSWASVTLDENDYLTAAVHGLRLAPKLAATDYGTSRQRDLGQLWTDAIRGFLGEIAFVKWLKQRFGVEAELDFRRGALEEFLPSDIRRVKGPSDEEPREPKLKVSVKMTKIGGIWLDVPYEQIAHSDIFVLVRVGITREHFVAFLKKISVLKNKIFEEAIKHGIVTQDELKEIWEKVPDFTPVPAYVAGFIDKREIETLIANQRIIEVGGRVGGRKRTKLTINRYLGLWDPREKERYKQIIIERCKALKSCSDIERLASGAEFDIEFELIGSFSETLHFIASSGVLKKKKEDWEKVLKEL